MDLCILNIIYVLKEKYIEEGSIEILYSITIESLTADIHHPESHNVVDIA